MSKLADNRRIGNGIGALACAALMAYALYAQHVLGLEPCPLCIFQRIAVIALGIIFLIAAVHNPGTLGARFYATLLLITAIAGGFISGRHVWIQAQPEGSVPACGAGLDYMMDIMPLSDVVAKVLSGSGECSRIEWRLLGLSMPWWVLFAILALAAWALLVNWPAQRKPGVQWRS
jgi:disulfide bond formation protein DsbB